MKESVLTAAVLFTGLNAGNYIHINTVWKDIPYTLSLLWALVLTAKLSVEPGLAPLRERTLHQELRQLLLDVNYRGYVSVEMGRTDNLKILESRMEYVRSIFA